MKCRLLVLSLLLTRAAYAEEGEGRARAAAFYTGPRFGVAPGIFVSGSRVGFSLGATFGYGVDTGSVIVVPGASAVGIFAGDSRLLALTPA
jgi:hypothetical protein